MSKESLPNRDFRNGLRLQTLTRPQRSTISLPSFRSEPFVEALNFASVDAPQEQSEYALAGLTPVSSKLVQPPYVGESPFAMECRVDFTKEYDNEQGQHTTTLVIARVVMIHVREDCIKDGGLVSYRRREAFQLNRGKYAFDSFKSLTLLFLDLLIFYDAALNDLRIHRNPFWSLDLEACFTLEVLKDSNFNAPSSPSFLEKINLIER